MSRKDLEALGSQRESLSKNPLLIQSEVGKIRRRCFTLPPTNFTYGVQSVCEDGGAARALTTWKFHTPSRSRGPKKMAERDFIEMNKAAIQSGLTTAQEQQHFRATNDIRRKDDSETRFLKTSQEFPENMVFGISTRPSTPIHSLLENKFQNEWLVGMREDEHKKRVKIAQKKLQGKVYETRTSLLRRYSEPVDPPPQWKMSRWRNIPGSLETFRTEKERAESFHHHASDGISRTGVFGHGIYQAAKS